MKKTSKLSRRGTQVAFALVLPLVPTALPAGATSLATAGSTVTAPAAGVATVQKINPTTVEVLLTNGERLTLDFYGENIFRLFQDNNGGILRDPQATPPAQILTDNPRKAPGAVTARMEGTVATVGTAKISVRIDTGTGLLTITNLTSGKKVVEETEPAKLTEKSATLTLKARPGEYFYGGGVQNGRFSHRGQTIAIENTNNWVDGGVSSPTPFYWSTEGYGVMWHTFKPGTYDFGETEKDKVILSHQENYLDVFFMVSDSPVALLNDFYQLTGHPVLLPKYGFYEGHLNAYNRDYWKEDPEGSMLFEDGKRYKESQKDNGGSKESLNGEAGEYQFSARAVVDRYAAHDMPLGWILPNDGYASGYGQTGSLDGNIQNLKSFSNYTREHGVEVGLWTQSDLHPKEGVEPLLQRDIVKEVRDGGVRVLKTDVAWVGPGYSFGLNGVADIANVMTYYGNDARPCIISVDGWAGTQRYASIWTGDQTGGDWEYIRYHIPTFIGSGLSGQPNITSDVDGIFGGKNVPVNVREFQWKTFTPMELNMDGWGSNPKYPQALGEPAASINRSYLKLKSELLPYTYTIAHEAISGKPMVRAMFLDYPNEYTLGTATQYQFMYGPSFLVAPIYKNTQADSLGNNRRDGIYLPEGRWIDYFSGDVYEGNRVINNYDAPLWKLPVFVRSGAIIPMTNPNNNVSQIRRDYRAYELYPDGESTFREYDDDGRTQEYLNGHATETLVESSVEKDKLTVSIHPTTGNYTGFEKEKQTELRINVTAAPKKVTAKVGKKSVKLTAAASLADFEKGENVYFYNAAPNLNRFSTPGSEAAKAVITKNPQLLVKVGKTDVTENGVELTVKGFTFAPADRLLTKTGALAAPSFNTPDANIQAYTATPTWTPVENADYYEVELGGMLYSTIRDCQLLFEGLSPETSYGFKVRAVNRDGQSDWASATITTKANPLEFAIAGIKGQTSCENQAGSDIAQLFDYDEKTMWHTVWGKNSLPFDMTLDLGTVNQLDKLEYLPREDGGNGTLLEGTYALSTDKQTWSEPVAFKWEQNGEKKTLAFEGNPAARYVRLHITNGVGGFGSGREMYIFKVPGSESLLQGDINHDKKIDENDLTSYMNYTGVRKGDADYDYVSDGDINRNGLIDAYDISVVTTQLDGGVRASNAKVEGSLSVKADKTTFKAGDVVELHVSGKALKNVNGLSFALPYDAQLLEYAGTDLVGMKEMVNLTYDRLHTNGQKALYPTFVNKGDSPTLDGDGELFVIKFKAKKDGRLTLKAQDGLLVDRNLGTVKF